MNIPISDQMVVLYGNPDDPLIIATKAQLENQGRNVEVLHQSIKQEAEIQRAHDILSALVLGELEIPSTQQAIQSAHIALDVLCWILNHDHNAAFQDNLNEIANEAERRGYKLTKQP